MKTNPRYHSLDLLRFVAALAVMAFHYCFRWFNVEGPSLVNYEGFGAVARYGYLGVDLFFMISGFVIAASAQGRSAGSFLKARARRLYPAFWIACTLTALATMAYHPPPNAVGLRQYLLNLTMFGTRLGVRYVDGVYWSLDIEIRFYLLVGLVLLLGRIRHLSAVLLAWVALCFLYASVRAAGFGILLAPLATELALQYAPLFAALALAVHRAQLSSALYATVIHPVVAALLVLRFHAVFCLIAISHRDLPNWRILPVLGGLTYPLYLLHQRIGYILLNATIGFTARYLVLVLLMSYMLVLSWLVHRYGEPMLRAGLDRVLAWRFRTGEVAPESA